VRDAILVTTLALSMLAPVDSLDHRLQRAAQGMRTPALEGPMRLATDIGKPVLVAGALVIIGMADRTQGVALLRTAALALIPTNLAVEGLKRATFRARPDGEHKRSNSSFPSSHAANAFAIAWVLARRWRRGLPWFLLAATVIAVSRVYLDRHFPSDVLVGAAIGTACAAGAAWWEDRRARAATASPGPGRH
jgi:membrane-associated phospholipid phosphatase